MSVEAMRGCGYRKVGGLYLCGSGAGMDCDRLPYELKICPVCGNGIKFSRGWTWLNWDKYAGNHRFGDACSDEIYPFCPVCEPDEYAQPYGLLWVGEANYTPETFITEALTMGISRKIAAVPRLLKLSETWVLFAHIKACGERDELQDDDTTKVVNIPGIFYAFRPQSLELLIWESEAKPEYLADLEKRNITPIIIPNGDKDHDPKTKTKVTTDDRVSVDTTNKIAAIRQSIGR